MVGYPLSQVGACKQVGSAMEAFGIETRLVLGMVVGSCESLCQQCRQQKTLGQVVRRSCEEDRMELHEILVQHVDAVC